jgi:hypothetical protein
MTAHSLPFTHIYNRSRLVVEYERSCICVLGVECDRLYISVLGVEYERSCIRMLGVEYERLYICVLAVEYERSCICVRGRV